MSSFTHLRLWLKGFVGKGYFPVEHEIALRGQLLRPILMLSGVAALVILLFGAAGVARSPIFPLDGLILLAASLISGWLLRRNNPIAAGVIFITISTQPLHYLAQSFGLQSPVNALFLAGILLCGLLIGNWFVGMWTLWYCIWFALAGYSELTGGWTVPDPISTAQELWTTLGFWWGAALLTGWLVSLFARNLERSLIVARGQTSALTHTTQALSGETGLDAFIGQALKAAAEQLNVQWAGLYLHDPESGVLFQRMGFGQGRLLSGEALQAGSPQPIQAEELPIWNELLTRLEPVVIYDISNDPRLRNRALILSQGIKSLLYVPLLVGGEMPGFLSVNSVKPRRFSAHEIELAQALAQQIALAIQLTRVSAQAESAAVVEERNRMARVIHDTLAQGFTGIAIQLASASEVLEVAPEEAREHLERARGLARESLQEARRSVRALRPEALETENPLEEALRTQADKLAEGSDVNILVETLGQPRPVGDAQAEALLRIGQEALANALKHAQAGNIAISLDFREGIKLTVEDDGIGFDPAEVSGEGFGLTSMRERAEDAGGELLIEPADGHGCCVRASLPQVVTP